MEKRGVLMVCLGNICRSPIAEAVFQHVVKERGLEDKWFTDSAATSGHEAGSSPDPRSVACIKRHGIKGYKHTARKITKEDYRKFDFIFGMDQSNLRNLKSMAPSDAKAEIGLLGDYYPKGKTIIEDPWYDSDDKGFERCFEVATASVNAFLDQHS